MVEYSLGNGFKVLFDEDYYKRNIETNQNNNENEIDLELKVLNLLYQYPEYIPYFDIRLKYNQLKYPEHYKNIRNEIVQLKKKQKKDKKNKKIIEQYLESTREINTEFIYIEDNYIILENEKFFAVKPSLNVITGLNGVGKSLFLLYVLKFIKLKNPKYKITYILNEDFTLPQKISDFYKRYIRFEIPQDFKSVIYLIETSDIIVIDSFSNLDVYEGIRAENYNAFFAQVLKDLYLITHHKKASVFLISHLTKQAREQYSKNNSLPSFYDAYGGRLSIYCDTGVVLHRQSKDKLMVNIQKNRYDPKKEKTFYYYDYNELSKEVYKNE
jgi:hypothetical protein